MEKTGQKSPWTAPLIMIQKNHMTRRGMIPLGRLTRRHTVTISAL